MFPTGTVTFLFTDIEGSTRLWQEKPQSMAISHARHDAMLTAALEANKGYIFQTAGDSFSAAFSTAAAALCAALSAQRQLNAEPWGETGALKVRMGLHTGAAQLDSSNRYVEGYAALASTQRVMSAAHGGQVLLSQPTYDLLQNDLPEDVHLQDMGEHRLKDLRSPLRLYQLNAPGLPQEFPPIKSLNTSPNNLPLQLTSFIGREKEIAEIKGLLYTTRLVTLTGSGGTGKTRLTQEIGAELLPTFPHGVWLIELAPLSDPEQIIPAIAQVFGLQELPFSPLANIVLDYLRDKKLLLILDNCEHLIEDCARLAGDLLRQCAGLKILASSREALGIAGEAAYFTPSLADSESTQLFIDRARAANSNFHLTAANAPAVAQICRRLDGIPLAIELAAARTKLLSAEQIAARLDDMFRLLVGGSRTALPRQQTLRALIDWSYDLLSDEEKRLLQFASVFVNGWTLEALEAVAGEPDTLELLDQLVNKSLVTTEEHETEMRYFMLETIRQYAREKLFDSKEASTARDRHFAYFNELSEEFWNIYLSKNILALRNRADDEAENLRAALEWGLDNQIEQAINLSANFCLVCGWMGSGLLGGLDLNKRAIEYFKALPGMSAGENREHQHLLAKAFFAQGTVGMGSGNMPVVLQDLQEGIAHARAADDKLILGYCLEMYYTASTFINASMAEEAAEEGYRIFRDQVNDMWGLSMGYQNMARVAGDRGNAQEKNMYLAKYKELIQEAPISFQAGLFYLGSGMNEASLGNFEVAKSYFEDGLQIFTKIRNRNFELVMRSELGHIARRTGKLAEARQIYAETLRGWQDLGNRPAVANQFECFAFIALEEAQPQRAAKLLGAAETLREKTQSPMTAYERAEYNQFLAQLRALLPEAELNSSWAEGRTMTMEQAIQFALETKPE